ncbi:MAG: hypothetical protein RIT81_15835 [Deltaproteobacteria bacterium]
MRRLLPLLLLTACGAPAWKQTPHDVRFQRTPPPTPHAAPKPNEPSDSWYAIEQTTARPIATALNPGHYIDLLRGGPPPLDVNAFGEVVDSVWFENRLGRRALTVEEIRRGPNEHDGPDERRLEVLGGKIEGATPGLVLRDARGDRYVAKFDPPAYPGLASGAEIIATKILWAAGYHVPENYVGTLDMGALELKDDATTGGHYGERIPLDRERLDDLLAHVNPFPDGTVRTLYSRFLPGRLIGPFHYRGQRPDDPNDVIPHERRRSLRGLGLFSAWLNNVDARASNTLDVFIPGADGRGYVKHYQIDFGDALGSAGLGPKYLGEGYEGVLDWPKVLRSLTAFGVWYRPWLGLRRSPYRAVGVFEADVFTPDAWRSKLPNPAFDEATWLDRYWAASIIARFTPSHLAAIVEEAGYIEPGASAWILRVLQERQFKILEWVFARVLPLDDVRVNGATLSLTDLERTCGLLTNVPAAYTWSVRWDDQFAGEGNGPTPTADLAALIAQARATHGAAFDDDPFLTVTFARSEPAHGATVDVHVRVVEGALLPVGLDRTVD